MNKFLSMIVAGLYLVVFTMTVSPALCADNDSVPAKENRTYEVNEEYIERKAAEKAARPSVLMAYVKENLAEESLAHKFYFLLYMLMPFAILAISLWMEFSKDGWGNERKLFLLGLAEFIFGVGNAGMGAGVYPWFCDFEIVGWITTIVCFCYMIRILLKQAGLFVGFINVSSDGLFMKKVIYYAIYIGIALSMTTLLSAKTYFWVAPFVVAAAWYYLYKNEYGDVSTTTRALVNTGVMFGGFIILFLQVLGLIITVAMVLFLLSGFASISSSSSSPSVDDGDSPRDGMLERAADGTPFVRHRDGSTTQLMDNGDGSFRDSKGHTWGGNGSGSLFR